MPSPASSVHRRVAEASPGEHLAGLFASHRRLIETACAFARAGLRDDQPVVLVLADSHHAGVRAVLEAHALPLPRLESEDALIVASTQELADRVMPGGVPDRGRFRRAVESLIDRAGARRRERPVRLFGDLIQLARADGNHAAAIRLEQLWRELVVERQLISLCGYDVAGPHGEPFPKELARSHTEVLREASARERLIQAAGELFAAGFDEATTAAIARRAGSSESQIVKHFGGKLGLLQAIFERWWDEALSTTTEVADSGLGPRQTVVSILDSTLAMLRLDPALARVVLFETRRLRGADQILSQGLLRFVHLLDGILERAAAEGRLAAGFRPATARDALLGACEGLLRSHLIAESTHYPAPYGLEEIRTAYVALIDALLPSRAGDTAP